MNVTRVQPSRVRPRDLRFGSLLTLAILAACGGSPPPPPTATPTPAAGDPVHHLNVGMAYLEQHRFGQAEEQFRAALALDDDYLEARIDLAIALAAEVEYEPALAELERALEIAPEHPTALYMLGLIHKYRGEKEAAIAAFEKVHAVDPHDTDSKYNLATSYKDRQQFDRAIPLLEEVIAASPHFASAYYALGQAYMRLGMATNDADAEAKGRAAIARFQELSGGTSAETHGLRYGEQGRYAMGVEDGTDEPPPPPTAIRFSDAGADRGLTFRHRGGGLGGGVLFFDLDADGDDDVLLLGAAEGGAARLYRNDAGQLTDSTDLSGLGELTGDLHGVAAGDVDRDGHPDVLIDGRLFMGAADHRFTERNLTEGGLGEVASAGFVDLDHDGDLDLVAAVIGTGLVSYVNDGSGAWAGSTGRRRRLDLERSRSRSRHRCGGHRGGREAAALREPPRPLVRGDRW